MKILFCFDTCYCKIGRQKYVDPIDENYSKNSLNKLTSLDATTNWIENKACIDGVIIISYINSSYSNW